MTYQIAICDDEKADQDYLSMLVNKWAANNQHFAVVDRYDSAEAFLFRYADHRRTDILLLDIEMGAMNGVELAQQIRRDNSADCVYYGLPRFYRARLRGVCAALSDETRA